MYPVAACRDKNELSGGSLCAVVIPGGVFGGGDTFDCYPEQDPVAQALASGSRWTGAWNLDTNYLQVIGQETFEFYNEGSDVSNLNQGSGWNGAWNVADNYGGTFGQESFEDYALTPNIY